MVGDPFGSTDANIIQLRGLLKSGGRDLVRDRDWTHLIKEYSFVTWPNWIASTAYTASAGNWFTGTAYVVGDTRTSPPTLTPATSRNLYRCTVAGTSNANGPGPSAASGTQTDGTVTWAFVNTNITGGNNAASVVTHGQYYYLCTGSPGSALSGTSGPYGTTVGGTETDGVLTWQCVGRAADYALPSDFSNLIDQTGWNRTNSLPIGGPVDGQTWQYLKGRAQGVVFNVLFRPIAGLMRLYPDTDTPGGYQITFEYMSNYWTSATGGTAPTADAPTLNGDIIYFDSLLMVRRLKLDWLKTKGFDTTHAQREYDDELEKVKNSDGSAPVLNLQGHGPYGPLIGVGNAPWTGFGS